MINALISTLVKILIGWLLVDRVPQWLSLRGFISTLVKIIGVLVIISALLDWV